MSLLGMGLTRWLGASLAPTLMFVAGCTADEPQPSEAECTSILTVGSTTYFGVLIWMPGKPQGFERGTISACSDGVSPHHNTGMSVSTLRLSGFSTDEALLSWGGAGDPMTLWIATSGDEPPFLVPPDLQTLIAENPVPPPP